MTQTHKLTGIALGSAISFALCAALAPRPALAALAFNASTTLASTFAVCPAGSYASGGGGGFTTVGGPAASSDGFRRQQQQQQEQQEQEEQERKRQRENPPSSPSSRKVLPINDPTTPAPLDLDTFPRQPRKPRP